MRQTENGVEEKSKEALTFLSYLKLSEEAQRFSKKYRLDTNELRYYTFIDFISRRT